MLLELLNEGQGSVAALFSEEVALLIDLNTTVVDPNKVLLCDLDLRLDFLAVCSGIVTDLLVLVSDVCQINDLAPELFLLCGINLISLCLSINISLLKVAQ